MSLLYSSLNHAQPSLISHEVISGLVRPYQLEVFVDLGLTLESKVRQGVQEWEWFFSSGTGRKQLALKSTQVWPNAVEALRDAALALEARVEHDTAEADLIALIHLSLEGYKNEMEQLNKKAAWRIHHEPAFWVGIFIGTIIVGMLITAEILKRI